MGRKKGKEEGKEEEGEEKRGKEKGGGGRVQLETQQPESSSQMLTYTIESLPESLNITGFSPFLVCKVGNETIFWFQNSKELLRTFKTEMGLEWWFME